MISSPLLDPKQAEILLVGVLKEESASRQSHLKGTFAINPQTRTFLFLS
jgi:hypothetical protein